MSPIWFSRRARMVVALAAFSWGCGQSNDTFKGATAPPDTGIDTPDAGLSTDTTPDTQTAIDPTLADSQKALIAAECNMMSTCCSADELKQKFGIDGVDTDCTSFQSALPVSVHLSNLTNSIREGRIKFDAGMAALCYDAYIAQPCEEWTRLSPSATTLSGCPEMLVAQVEVGGACRFDYDCIGGFCKQADDAEEDDEKMGTCTAYAGDDENCFGATCAEGFYCDEFDDACIAQRSSGASCFDDEECTSQSCASDSDGNMTCAAPLPLCTSQLDVEP